MTDSPEKVAERLEQLVADNRDTPMEYAALLAIRSLVKERDELGAALNELRETQEQERSLVTRALEAAARAEERAAPDD